MMFSFGPLLSLFALSNLLVQGLPLDESNTSIVEYTHPLEHEQLLEPRDVCEDSEPIRGVNIGGWLVLETWMNWELVQGTDAVDQWTFDKTSGARQKLQSHWSSWFTEADMAQIAAWGLNTVRIPVGFWAYNNAGTPYISGADAHLEQALGWARKYNIKALICMHGLPGSQNGFDNSGHRGPADWAENEANLAASTAILKTLARKYGSNAWADVVWGLELVNEPIVWDYWSTLSVINWANSTIQTMRQVMANKEIKLVMHDAFVGAKKWQELGDYLNRHEEIFYLDVHLYQNQGGPTSEMNQQQHIQTTCGFKQTQFLPDGSRLPILVGEFSDQTNICVDENGVVTAGTSCSTRGCQCSAQLDPSQWNNDLKKATRKFMEAQMDVFEEYSEGWFLWSYSGPGAWGMGNLFDNGILGPSTVADRKYAKQCP